MKKLWESKKYRYSLIGIVALLVVGLGIWLVMRPKPIMQYSEFANKYNDIVEEGGSRYRITDYDVSGTKRIGPSNGELVVKVDNGQLMEVGAVHATGGDIDDFIVASAAAAKAIGLNKDTVLNLCTQSEKAGKGKKVDDGDFHIETTVIKDADVLTVNITKK